MQLQSFHNGGFVLHKVPATSKACASAWYDNAGNLLAAELVFSGFCRVRNIAPSSARWQELEKLGSRYKHIPAPSVR